jgi:hypothetical protein
VSTTRRAEVTSRSTRWSGRLRSWVFDGHLRHASRALVPCGRRRVKLCLVSSAVLMLLTATASDALAATQFERYEAWTAEGEPVLADVTDPTDADEVDCIGSFKSSRPDAWRCLVADPCFENPVIQNQLLCVGSPWALAGYVVHSRLDQQSHGTRKGGRPWAVVLANGKRCTFLAGGTAVGPGGHRLNYGCGRAPNGGFLFGIPRRDRPTWTIRFSRKTFDEARYRWVNIRTVWH